jgi:hypothetical protein
MSFYFSMVADFLPVDPSIHRLNGYDLVTEGTDRFKVAPLDGAAN